MRGNIIADAIPTVATGPKPAIDPTLTAAVTAALQSMGVRMAVGASEQALAVALTKAVSDGKAHVTALQAEHDRIAAILNAPAGVTGTTGH
jgi:hypothetical protein